MVKVNPTRLPWLPLHAKIWNDSETINGMTSNEEGIYIRLITHEWELGPLPYNASALAKLIRRNYRSVRAWLQNYNKLIAVSLHDRCTTVAHPLQCRCTFTIPKLGQFAATLGKSRGRGAQIIDGTFVQRKQHKEVPEVPVQAGRPVRVASLSPTGEDLTPNPSRQFADGIQFPSNWDTLAPRARRLLIKRHKVSAPSTPESAPPPSRPTCACGSVLIYKDGLCRACDGKRFQGIDDL
jgi:hypothetical protein